MKTTFKRALSFFMVLSLIFSAVPAVFAAENVSGNESAVNSVSTGSNMTAAGIVTVAQTTNNLAPGVTQTEIITRNSSNQQNMGYLTVVDLSQDVTVKASYNGYYTAGSTAAGRSDAAENLGWGFETTTGQAAAYESAADTEGTVVMATNGDYFNMGTGEPLGYLIMEGNAIKTTGEPYFAILKDGTAVIRDAGTDHSDVVEAISGPFYLVKNGVIDVAKDADQMPRNSVGIRADGSVVFFLNDGRQSPMSVGMTLYETATVLLDAGCVTALYLDGGGSATVAARPEGSDSLVVTNSPSDGQEREVSSAIMVVSTAKPTGVFDHASISPKNELYTPGSTVQFTASGVDTAGTAVEIPADVTWALAEDSKDMGTIDANGLFTAGDKTGAVTVIMTQNGETVGSTTIEIATPDQIYFNSDEISLGFEDATDLGLVVRYQNRDINYKVGDIVWTTTNDALGTFDGNIFTASDGESLNGNITATSAFDPSVSGTIHVIVGMLPTIVWDFEDVVGEDGSVTSAEDYYGGLLTHGNYGRGGQESIEIVSIDDDEPVRFGEKSLKLNFDFTQCGAVTEGAIIGTSETFTVPGTPTGIGVWVYAPEGVGITWEGDGTQAGFWLRGYVLDGDGINQPYDFTLEPKAISPEMAAAGVQPGIYWEGWMYLEADLTNIKPPYSILKGNTFRLMFVNGTMMGTKTANSIYFDNLQFVYGTNVDDIDSPKVDSIAIGTNELNDGDVLTTNTFTLRTTFSDVQNKYTSGIDANTVRMYIDGVNVVDNDKYQFALNANDGYAELYDLTLADGVHSITVSMRDNFGNDVEETRYFTVKGGVTAPTTVTVAPVESIASLGGVVTLEVRASDATVLDSTTTIRLSNMFPDYEVVFSDNYEGTFKYSKSAHTITISATRSADAEGSDLIAKVIVKVPATLTENESFLYEVTSGIYTTSGEYYGTYSAPEAILPVGAGIAVSCDPILVGGEKAVVKVTDLEGKGVANAGIYLTDGTLIGTTDENGQWVTDYFSSAASKVAVYAQTADGLLSFQYNIFSYNAAVEAANGPASVIFNTPADSTTQKNITWTSSPMTAEAQSIRYRVQGTEEWTSVAAETTLLTFITGGNLAANANNVVLTGLTAGTTYEYQVGGGETWTEIAAFTTDAADEASTEFFVMADVQADDFTNVYNMIAKINEGGYDFGIQTGDAIDNVTSYSQVATALDLFSTEQLGELDMIRVLGNHEYYGDENAEITSTLYSISESKPGSCYSVTVGDVYVAVINFTNTNAELLPALEWLKADAQASDATWKVLTMHQPPYYTYTGGGNAPINTYVPAAAEEAGIDVVFSGHDHALARTNQLTDGKIDTDNGILYYIGGSSGEKSYPVNSQDVFDYETVFALATTDFSATYIGVTADKYQMTLNIYDVLPDGTQNVVDTYTLKSHMGLCAEAGHELENAVYADGMLICNDCGDTIDPVEISFTGWATDGETGRAMLFIAGVAQTGETLFGQDVYYFDENGVAYDGKVTIDEVEMEFDNGLLIGGFTGFIEKTDGNTYYYENGLMTYGWYEIDGYWYHFNTETGVMNTQTHVMPDDEAKSKNAYYDFGEDGKLLYAYFNPHGYYYWAGLPAVDQWVKLSSDPDAWYRTNGNGHFVTDRSSNPTVVIAVDGVEYTFDNTNGKLLKGSIVNDNGTLYYYWAGEPVNEGWFELDGNTYYAYADGHLAQGSNTIDGETYMFDMDGTLVTEGMILTAALNDECNEMTIKLVNADDDITSVRIALWPGDDQETLMWLDAEQDEQGMWIVTTPMCTFTNEVPAVFSVHAYTGEESDMEFLMSTTIEVPVAEHTYTDHRDTTCNLCGAVREVETVTGETTPMFRLYNPNSGEHFYTGSVEERENLIIAGWNYEGVAWNAPVNSGEHVYRLYNPNSGDHHYTMSVEERDWLVSLGWQYEGVAWNSATTDDVPQFRLYNPNADCGSHHYTSSTEERDWLVSLGWQYEGIGWYGTLK